MNTPISGYIWLLLVIVVLGLLALIALTFKSEKAIGMSNDKPKSKVNRDIARLNERLKKYFPSLTTKLQHNRIIAKDGNHKFMLTIDKKVSKGRRQLGDAKVINFHNLPSVNELKQLFDAYANESASP